MSKFEKIQLELSSLNQSKLLAKNIASLITKPLIILLIGDLGTGKTFLAREIINQLMIPKKINVKSPTYNILNLYKTDKLEINHLDLYRIKHINELIDLGIEEILTNSVCLIEWPEIAYPLLKKYNKLTINLSIDNKKRICLIEAEKSLIQSIKINL